MLSYQESAASRILPLDNLPSTHPMSDWLEIGSNLEVVGGAASAAHTVELWTPKGVSNYKNILH